MTNPSAQTMLADELQRLKDVSDSTHDGDPYGGSDTQDALDQCIEDNFPTIISALRAASAPAAVRDALATVESLIRRDPACFNLSDELQSVRKTLRALATPKEASTEKQPICTHPNCSCAGRRCLAYDGSREEASTAAGEAVAWRVKNDHGYWHATTDKALAETWRDIEKFDVQPLYAAPPATQTEDVRYER